MTVADWLLLGGQIVTLIGVVVALVRFFVTQTAVVQIFGTEWWWAPALSCLAEVVFLMALVVTFERVKGLG